MGFSKGWALFALKNPPPVGTPFFDDLLRGDWSLRDNLFRHGVGYSLSVSARCLYPLRVQTTGTNGKTVTNTMTEQVIAQGAVASAGNNQGIGYQRGRIFQCE